MATRYGKNARASWKIHPWATSDVIPAAEGTVEQMEAYRLAAYAPIEYRLRNGWPQAVPPYDVRAIPNVTCDVSVSSDRPDPTLIYTYADARWIANVNYDGTTWSPHDYNTGYSGLTWVTDSTFSPTVQSGYSYRTGKEIIVVDALNFTQDNSDHMWAGSGWSSALGDRATYTMIFVMKPNPSLNADTDNGDDDEYSGIICPATSTGLGKPGLRINSNCLEYQLDDTDQILGNSILSYQASNQPIYLAWVVGATTLKTFIGYGPNSLIKDSQYNPLYGQPIDWALNLMSASDDTTHTANLMLLDVCFFDHALSDKIVANRISLLSAAYGGK